MLEKIRKKDLMMNIYVALLEAFRYLIFRDHFLLVLSLQTIKTTIV